jgi:hypothetical protein
MTDQRLIAHVIIAWKGRRQTKKMTDAPADLS